MNYLLDTCVLSEFRKKLPEPKVLKWVGSQDEDSLFLSAITIGEIEKGICRMAPSKRKRSLMGWLEDVIYRYDDRILPLDINILREWGSMSAKIEEKGRVIPAADSFIAATARFHDLVLITRNEKDFIDTNIIVLNIWNS